MRVKRLGLILVFLFLYSMIGKADVPPDIGYVRVDTDLVIVTDEDLSDFRFFVDFMGDVKEIEVKNREKSTFPLLGGGVRYRVGKLLAIPVKSLSSAGLTGKLSEDQRDRLAEGIKNNKIENVQELGDHRFMQDIPIGTTAENPRFVLKHEGSRLNVTQISEAKPVISKVPEVLKQTPPIYMVIAGVLLALAAFILGFLAFRLIRKKV